MRNRREIEAIAARLREARMAIEPNQAAFARRAGLSQNRYNQYETGARPLSLDAALKLCETYGFTLDWLFRGQAAMMPVALAELLRRPPLGK